MLPKLSKRPRARVPRLSTSFGRRGQQGPRGVRVQPISPESEPPPDWPGTRPEWYVQQWLTRRGLEQGIDFESFQGILGPRRTLFGIEADFVIHRGAWSSLEMVWRVQGYYWHYVQGDDEVRAKDVGERLELESHGWTVVDILDLDVESPHQRGYTLEQALLGVEVIHTSGHIHSGVRR